MYTNTTSRGRFLAGLVVVSLFAVVALGGAVAAQTTTGNGTANGMGANATENVSLTPDTAAAGAITNHSLNLTPSDSLSGNLTGVSINYTAANASTEATLGDPDNISIMVGNHSVAGQTVVFSDRDNVTISAPNFRLVNFSFMGNQSFPVDAGENLSFHYPIQNPTEAGNYTVPIVLTSSANDSLSMNATLNVTPSQMGAPGGSMGSENVSLTPDTATAGALTNHTLNATVGEAPAGNLTGATINYTAANTSTEPVLDTKKLDIQIGNRSIPIGTDNPNATIAATNYRLVEYAFMLNDTQQPQAGDRLHLRYPIRNPSEAGNYTVGVVLNPDGNNTQMLNTTLSITPNETASANGTTTANGTGGMNGTTTANGTTTMNGTTQNTTMGTTQGSTTETQATVETTQGSATATTAESTQGNASTTSSGNGPGFTALVGLVGIIAVALLALRRN